MLLPPRDGETKWTATYNERKILNSRLWLCNIADPIPTASCQNNLLLRPDQREGIWRRGEEAIKTFMHFVAAAAAL